MSSDSQKELLSIDTPELPEVIVNGRKVAGGSREALSEVYELVNMANIARIRRYFDERTPKGITEDVIINATDQLQRIDLTYKAKSIALINDGPSVCAVWLQYLDSYHNLGVNETYAVDYEVPRLDVLWVQCNPGLVATIRATGLS